MPRNRMEERRAPGERRSKQRFSMQCEVCYKLLNEHDAVETGAGSTTDISSCSVAFNTSRVIEVGTVVELSICWPALLNDTCPLKLVAYGHIVRSEGRKAVCSIEKYEFRTLGSRSPLIESARVNRSEAVLRNLAEGGQKATASRHAAAF